MALDKLNLSLKNFLEKQYGIKSKLLKSLSFVFQLRAVLKHRGPPRPEVVEASAATRCSQAGRRQHQVHQMGERQASRYVHEHAFFYSC